MPTDVWLGASYALGRPAPVTEPYPHICHLTVVGRMTGRQVELWSRDCAACLQQQHTERPPTDPPPVTDEQRAEEARRMGERDL